MFVAAPGRGFGLVGRFVVLLLVLVRGIETLGRQGIGVRVRSPTRGTEETT